MQDERFEWDDEKAVANWRKHGVSFKYAGAVFDDFSAVDSFDDRATMLLAEHPTAFFSMLLIRNAMIESALSPQDGH